MRYSNGWKGQAQPDRVAWRQIRSELLREWIEADGSAWLPLIGKSMTPVLPSGSRVLVVRVTANQIRCGDLLVYEGEESLICHRVLRWQMREEGYSFFTKGDAWETCGSWIYSNQVIGRVIGANRGGRIIRLDTPFSRLLAVGATVRSLLVSGSLTVLRAVRKLVRGEW